MLSRLRAPLLFFLLGTPIAVFIPIGIAIWSDTFLTYLIAYFLPNIVAIAATYVYGAIYSLSAGLLFSTLGGLYQRHIGPRINMPLGGVIGALSGALLNYLALGRGPVLTIEIIFWGGVAGLACGLLYTYQCGGRFVPVWGDTAFRDAENAAATTAQLGKFLRLKTDGTLDGPHGHCPSCNAFIAQDLAECPSCKVNLSGPDAFKVQSAL